MKLASLANRRSLLAAATLALAAALLPLQAEAQPQWPTRPIKLIVPFAPGGSNDNIARVLGAKLSARLGQPIVIENKAGSGGTIGTDFVAKSAPDGYTLLLVSASLTTNAAAGKKLPYNPERDLQPIGLIAASPFAIVVSNDFPAKDLKEFLKIARAKPRTINYGSAGMGGMNHLGTELFASAAKVQLVHVPYKGIAPAFTDLMGGQLQMLLPSVASVTAYVQAGRMRALAVTSAQRSPLAPEIPTVAEAAIPGFKLEVWFGLMGPAHMPVAIINKLNSELNAALATPEMKEMLAREGASPQPGRPIDFANQIHTDMVRWDRLIKDNNIQVE